MNKMLTSALKGLLVLTLVHATTLMAAMSEQFLFYISDYNNNCILGVCVPPTILEETAN